MAIQVRPPEVKSMWGASQEELKAFWLSLPKERQVTTRLDGNIEGEYYSQEYPHTRTVIVDPTKMIAASGKTKPIVEFFLQTSQSGSTRIHGHDGFGLGINVVTAGSQRVGEWHTDGEKPMFEEKHAKGNEAAKQGMAIAAKLADGRHHQCNGITKVGKQCQRILLGSTWSDVSNNCNLHDGLK